MRFLNRNETQRELWPEGDSKLCPAKQKNDGLCLLFAHITQQHRVRMESTVPRPSFTRSIPPDSLDRLIAKIPLSPRLSSVPNL